MFEIGFADTLPEVTVGLPPAATLSFPPVTDGFGLTEALMFAPFTGLPSLFFI